MNDKQTTDASGPVSGGSDESPAALDAALTAFLGHAFPTHYSPAGAAEYRTRMARAIAAYGAPALQP